MTDTGASFGGKKKFEGAGGSPGGLGEFFIGIGLAALGFYLLFSHVYVQTAGFGIFGMGGGFGMGLSFGQSFGLTLLPLLIGIGVLFVNGKSVVGWVLAAGGLLMIAIGILMSLHIYFRPTSLFEVIAMFGLIAAGLGLVVKSLRPHGAKAQPEKTGE